MGEQSELNKDLLSLEPSNDTGADTLSRYMYQAYTAVPFCLECVSGGSILSLIMEHFEDLVIEYSDHWLFLQIKTRNPDLGPWKVSYAMDGFKSLYRTFKATEDYPAIYSLHLEGAIASGDVLNDLVPPNRDISAALKSKIMNGLGISEDECIDFLKLITVKPNQTSRQEIISRNICLLGHQSPTIPIGALRNIHQRLSEKILAAMARERVIDLLPKFIGHPSSLEDIQLEKIEVKRLTRDGLRIIMGPVIEGPFPFIKRLVDENLPQPSDLETKLLAAGAEDFVIKDAKNLRANATIIQTEILSAGVIDQGEEIENVSARLEVLVNAIVQKHMSKQNPVVHVWPELLSELANKAIFLDPNRIYRQDPYVLLGVACNLADECRTHWGVKIA